MLRVSYGCVMSVRAVYTVLVHSVKQIKVKLLFVRLSCHSTVGNIAHQYILIIIDGAISLHVVHKSTILSE